MMRLHRSDSLDEILEKINTSVDENQLAGKKFEANVINRVSLKLNDINKELEYNTQVRERKLVQASVKKIYVILAMFVFLLLEGIIYKLVMLKRP
jgi:class 3 adenylate cyclase